MVVWVTYFHQFSHNFEAALWNTIYRVTSICGYTCKFDKIPNGDASKVIDKCLDWAGKWLHNLWGIRVDLNDIDWYEWKRRDTLDRINADDDLITHEMHKIGGWK